MNGFSVQRLLEILESLPTPTRYLLAYSGGRDSHVLVHAMAALVPRLSAPVQVIHVHHGLHPDADIWVKHCQSACNDLGLPLVHCHVNAQPATGDSPEAAARQARYAAFADQMLAGDMLLTAHHQDDQAETLMLQLLRGAGPQGLAAMPVHKDFAKGSQLRPLLSFGRAELERYAHDQQLTWIHDGSNDELIYRRNYLRHEVMPALQRQWPAYNRTLSRSALLCAEATALLNEMASADLVSIARDEQLSVTALLALSPNRQRNVLRYWCRSRGLPLPAQAHMEQIQGQLCASQEHTPLIAWPGAELRRYQDQLYLMTPLVPIDALTAVDWDMESALDFTHGRLSVKKNCVSGLDATVRDQKIKVCFRQGGERVELASGQHHPLKKIFQQYHIPPWRRSGLPLIYVNDELAAVADILVAHRFVAKKGALAIGLDWQII